MCVWLFFIRDCSSNFIYCDVESQKTMDTILCPQSGKHSGFALFIPVKKFCPKRKCSPLWLSVYRRCGRFFFCSVFTSQIEGSLRFEQWHVCPKFLITLSDMNLIRRVWIRADFKVILIFELKFTVNSVIFFGNSPTWSYLACSCVVWYFEGIST